jgi:hypothetical protein
MGIRATTSHGAKAVDAGVDTRAGVEHKEKH